MVSDNKKYFHNIDALRFIAFLTVFCSHLFFTNNENINGELREIHLFLSSYTKIGISFFFTLSSFLITWIILTEYNRTNTFRLKNFYVRRALRIWPLYVMVLLVGYVILPLISYWLEIAVPQLPSIGWFLSFTANYLLAYQDLDFLFFLVFLWSISVEEQFYLIWGALMFFFYKHFQIIVLLLLIVFISFVLLGYVDSIPQVYYHTVFYIPHFVVGAYLAYSCFNQTRVFSWLDKRSRSFWIGFYSVFLLGVFFFQRTGDGFFMPTMWYALFAFLFGLLLFDQCFNKQPLFRTGGIQTINYLGKISFGLYCWHGVVITFVKKTSELVNYQESHVDVFLFFPVLTLLLTIFIAALSYKYIEQPFLKLKQYF